MNTKAKTIASASASAVLALLLASPLLAACKWQGYAETGGQSVSVGGSISTTKVQRSYPGALITVYNAGTLTPSTLYSDAALTPKPNPFSADSSGLGTFYTNTATVDIRFSGAGIAIPITRSGISVCGGAITSVIDVKGPPYNAVGDGVADDTVAISAAIVAAAANNTPKVIFPYGTYKITQQLKLGNVAGSLSHVSIIFEGVGQGASIITSTVTGTATWLVQNPDADAVFVWRDMSIVGPGGVYSPGANVGFSIGNAINLQIEHCEISNWADTAIANNGGYGCQFSRNYIHDIGNEGVLLNGNTGKGNRAVDNTLINIGGYAFDVNDSGSEIRGNACFNVGNSGTTSGITIEGDFGQNPSDIIVADNLIVPGILAACINISADGAAGSFVRHVVLTGNVCPGGGNVSYGVYITPQTLLSTISDITMSGNTFTGTNQAAVYATFGATRINVTGNRLDGATWAIRFDPSVTASIVGSNTLSGGANLIATSTLALDITSGGSTAKRALGATLVNGLNSNIALSNTSCLRVVGPTAGYSIGGFTAGDDGRELIVVNTMPQVMTVINEDASSTAANRITTLTGGNVVLRAGTSSATFIYDSTNSRWLLVATN